MRTLNVIIVAGVVALAFGLGWGIYAIAGNDSTQTCPDGQELVSLTVSTGKGTLSVDQDAAKLPPGYSFEASGGGTTVKSDAKSATVKGNGPLTLDLVCR